VQLCEVFYHFVHLLSRSVVQLVGLLQTGSYALVDALGFTIESSTVLSEVSQLIGEAYCHVS
jgi:hypothetical protein